MSGDRWRCGYDGCQLAADVHLAARGDHHEFKGTLCRVHADIVEKAIDATAVQRRLLFVVSLRDVLRPDKINTGWMA